MTEQRDRESSNYRQTYGSFHLADCELAIAASSVQQVVDSPSSFLKMPQSTTTFKGSINLRGTIVPVIDLRTLFEIQDSAPSSSKIAVVEHDDQCIGILFDRTGEVFKGESEERSDFDPATCTSFVSGVFKLQGGERLVQILDLEKLFDTTNVPRDVSSHAAAGWLHRCGRGRTEKCISFRLEDDRFALPISSVQEVLEIEGVTKTAFSRGYCLGITRLRDFTIPIIDLARFLGHQVPCEQHDAESEKRIVIVMRCESNLFGLLVDSVDNIVSFHTDEIVKFPSADFGRTSIFVGCIAQAERPDVIVLNHEEIVADEEIKTVSRMQAAMRQPVSEEGVRKKDASHRVRNTFLTFTADVSYAVKIDEVQEIIDLPDQLMRPLGLKSCFDGIHNLRGQVLVAIADLRSIHSRPQYGGVLEDRKVLVFDTEGGKAGLIVDSVDSIVSVSENEQIDCSPNEIDDPSGSASTAIFIPTPTMRKACVPIVNMESLLDSRVHPN